MKKIAALILALLLATPAALAGSVPIGGGLKATPAPEATETSEAGDFLSDPMARYEELTDPENPASDCLLRMMDAANDEYALTADGTAICESYDFVDETGAPTQQVVTYVYLTDYGYVFDVSVMPDGYHLYVLEDATYLTFDGKAMEKVSGGFSSDYPATPDMFLNKYEPEEKLLGVRAAGDGFCCLTELDDMRTEYEMGADFILTHTRMYVRDEAGDYRLSVYGDIALTEPPTLPESLIDIIGQ